MAGAAERAERSFERPHLGTENELAVVEHPRHCGINASAEAPALGSTVETPEGEGTVVGHNVPCSTRPCIR